MCDFSFRVVFSHADVFVWQVPAVKAVFGKFIHLTDALIELCNKNIENDVTKATMSKLCR